MISAWRNLDDSIYASTVQPRIEFGNNPLRPYFDS